MPRRWGRDHAARFRRRSWPDRSCAIRSEVPVVSRVEGEAVQLAVKPNSMSAIETALALGSRQRYWIFAAGPRIALFLVYSLRPPATIPLWPELRRVSRVRPDPKCRLSGFSRLHGLARPIAGGDLPSPAPGSSNRLAVSHTGGLPHLGLVLPASILSLTPLSRRSRDRVPLAHSHRIDLHVPSARDAGIHGSGVARSRSPRLRAHGCDPGNRTGRSPQSRCARPDGARSLGDLLARARGAALAGDCFLHHRARCGDGRRADGAIMHASTSFTPFISRGDLPSIRSAHLQVTYPDSSDTPLSRSPQTCDDEAFARRSANAASHPTWDLPVAGS